MAQRTQERLDNLFNKYYESDLKHICEKYDELCEQYKVTTKKDLKILATYPANINLSVSALRKAIANEIKAIIPKEYVEGAKKRKLARKQKEMDKKKRKYQKSHGHTCEKCGGKDFLSISSKYNDGGYCTLPSGKNCEGYTPSFAGICDSDQMLMDICVDCGSIYGLDVDVLKRQIAHAEGESNLREEEGESSTNDVFDYGVSSESDDDDDESEQEE